LIFPRFLEGKKMDKRRTPQIVEHLRRGEAQQRIYQTIQRVREEATVTISRAATLFGFSENQLRDWEEYGLLNPLRPSGTRAHRLYPIQELEKLALIRELMNAKFVPSEIPPDIDKVWQAISLSRERSPALSQREGRERTTALTINQRIEDARNNLFWDYFVSHVLHLSLALICEDVPNTSAGLVLPLEPEVDVSGIRRVEDLAQLGEVLVCRLGPSGSSQTLLMPELTFEYATDYRLLPLTVMRNDQPQEEPIDNTLIFIQRRSERLTLSAPVVETIRRLLRPIYEDIERSRSCFGVGMRDILVSSTNLHSGANNSDIILNGLAEMVVRLGGLTAEGESRWRFCCILLPQDAMLPLHQRTLVVRAQSKNAPYRVGRTIVTPDNYAESPSIRALQSGHIVYLPKISQTDTSIAFREQEEPIRSAVAIPIGGEDGLAIAVLYVASAEIAAFSESDQRVLRMICRMMEEALKTYAIRRKAIQKLTDIIEKPALVDPFFRDFLSENDFIRNVEEILSAIQTGRTEISFGNSYPVTMSGDMDTGAEELTERCVSFISVDVDRQSSVANKYGDLVTRNLAQAVGMKIKDHFPALVKEQSEHWLYHIYADRFYILMKNIPLERMRIIAERLRLGLAGTYKLDALQTSVDQSTRPESKLEIYDITVRLGVTSYLYSKLQEVLLRYPPEDAVAEVRSIISSALSVSLDKGRDEGGNVVISWDTTIRQFVPWRPALLQG
jgi:DNA-binding transcriptional MerR regulator/GGDEF domain-containing protein/GAF domain-containing protein